MNKGIGEYFKQTKAFKNILKVKIEEVEPDMIISFEPDGDSGHADHRLMEDILTELILREGWYDKYPLYFFGWTKGQAAKFGIEELNYSDSNYFNVAIHFSQNDEDKYFESIKCYKSQNTPLETDDWINIDRKDSSNVIYFRKFAISKDFQSKF